MYVAAKGGEAAIDNAHRLLARQRRGDAAVSEIQVEQIREQLGLAVDRVMAEGSLYDPGLAALAVKQAQGDLVEAVFLLRAFRTTLPRFGYSRAVNTESMTLCRRISAAFKDLPGGQVLGPTYDYTHRLLDFALRSPESRPPAPKAEDVDIGPVMPRAPSIGDLLRTQGLVEDERVEEGADSAGDLTREPMTFPASRGVRRQNMARGDEGFLLSLAYSLQRGFGTDRHPFLGEIRMGTAVVEFEIPELGFSVEIGEVDLTECTMLNRYDGSAARRPQMERGLGLVFGRNERKAMAMAIVDRALESAPAHTGPLHPAQNAEFVLSHSDNVEASGFVQHLKLPHYVDFQSERILLERIRRNYDDPAEKGSLDNGD